MAASYLTNKQITHKGLEQEKLQNLWISAFGALTPVFCFLVPFSCSTIVWTRLCRSPQLSELPHSRMQHENLDVSELTDEDAQEATLRACCSANPGIIIVGFPRTASKSHVEFCMTSCVWQYERSALYIMILTDSEDALSEEQFLALETRHRSEGSPGSNGISDKRGLGPGWNPTFLP